MYRFLGWQVLIVIIGIIIGIMVLLSPLFRRINKGKYVIYEGSLLTRKDLKSHEESLKQMGIEEHINEEDLIEQTEETANQLNPADREWFEKYKGTLRK